MTSAADHGGFRSAIDDRYFEDYAAGTVHEPDDTITVTEEDLLAFAKIYDPQSFHVDPVAAEEGPFNGLIASGWHTTALMMQLLARHYLSTVASLGSPGVDELRWLQPVRPGDSLRFRTEVLDTRRSKSDPSRGVVRAKVELIKQGDVPVLALIVVNFLSVRPVTS